LTGPGAEIVSYDPHNGLLTGSSLAGINDSYGYDPNGLFASYKALSSGNPLYSESVLRDLDNRITQKTETVASTTHVWGYTYDPTGRLTDVTLDGNFASHYAYDKDDNRTTFTNTSGTVNPTYDAQDRITTYGSTAFTYTANGELQSKTTAVGTTNYTYDALGNLLHVGLPSGTAIDYVVDGENRRIAKKVNGVITEAFLYQDSLKVVAQLDGSGNLVARYVFGSRPNVPDYYTTSAGTFRILADHLGSPRLILNASTGAVVEQIDYDEFGNVTNDTQPGTTPFGFAGGVYDPDTGLARFGARDYDASVGRWTAKDPLGFVGGINVYVYVGNSPVSRVDMSGRLFVPAAPVVAAPGVWGTVVGYFTASPAGLVVGTAAIYGLLGYELYGLYNDLNPTISSAPSGGSKGLSRPYQEPAKREPQYPECAGLSLRDTIDCCKEATGHHLTENDWEPQINMCDAAGSEAGSASAARYEECLDENL
jgi:RHS repeat-associated protein